jgi:peptidylprolyl isomerase
MFPPDLNVEIGVSFRVKHSDGHESDAFVTAIDGDKVKVDGNHPLAGKELEMEIELVAIEAV